MRFGSLHPNAVAFGAVLLLASMLLVWRDGLAGGNDIRHDVFTIDPADGDSYRIERLRPAGSARLLTLWFVDHDERRPRFDAMLESLAAAGIEVWRVDLLGDLFLPRGNEQARRLPGEPVAEVIAAATRRRDEPILLVSYDRMALPLLRGLRLWQGHTGERNRPLGAALFYPNLFGPAPPAGEAPTIDPVVAANNYPVVIFQPEYGSHRWRIGRVMETFWRNDAPALLYRIGGIRDWFFMDDEEHDEPPDAATTAAVRKVPAMLLRAARLLKGYPPPTTTRPLAGSTPAATTTAQLEPLPSPRAAPPLRLRQYPEQRVREIDFRDRLTLVVFWASWCPPCVEEMPSLNRLRKRYAGRPFRIISVDFQETPTVIARFLQRTPVDFPILLDHDGSAASAWGVFSFPSSFLVDADGRISHSVNRAIDWDTPEVRRLIDRLLGADTSISRGDPPVGKHSPATPQRRIGRQQFPQ